MERYTTSLKIDTSKKIPYYTTVIPKRVPSEEIPFYYVTQDGDRLDTLSYKFYSTTANWWILAKANNLANGSMSIPMGTRLFIPNV
jgi:phage tail protein X